MAAARPLPSVIAFTLAASLLGGACGDDGVAEAPLESACLATDVVRIADLPPGWPTEGLDAAYASLRVVGRSVLVRWDALEGDNPRDILLIDPCGPATDILAPGELGVRWVSVLDTPDGPVAYGVAEDEKTLYRLDRLDSPEIDDPEAIFNADRLAAGLSFGDVLVLDVNEAELWTFRHSDAAPVQVAVDVAAKRYFRNDDGSYAALLRTDAGVLNWHEALPGPGEVLQTGTRYAMLTPDRRHLVWQALGDGVAEPVFLRDLDSGEEVMLTVNDFVAASFGASPADKPLTADIGTWVATGDSSVVALIGPDNTIREAFLTATGVALDVPTHTSFLGEFYGVYRDTFELNLSDSGEHVAVLWTPRTGELSVVYRGPDAIDFVDYGAEGFEYRRTALDHENRPSSNYSLWRFDRASGESTQILPRVGSAIDILDDGRLLYGVSDRSYDELTVFDPTTGVFKAFGTRAKNGWKHVPGLGVVYLDVSSSTPGLYLAPIPLK